MNSKKVLLGLILAAFVGSAGMATAQIKANYHNDLIEIGPDNIGGRTRAIVVDESRDSSKVIYAGGVAGGLYKKEVIGTWEYIPCYINGKEVTLPISYMVQTPNDNNIYIATGEGLAVGENANKAFIVPKGRGLYRIDPNAETPSFELIPNTDPATNADWTYINRLACLYRDNSLYFYAGTNAGLFRWKINSASDWNTAPEKVFDGAVQDIEIVSNDNMLFFTSGSHLYKIGNVTGEGNYSDISATNSAFGGNATRIELASAHSDKTYLYALVTDEEGMCEGIFLSTDQQTWSTLASSTVTPFSVENPGWHNSTITVDPQNHKRVFVGGASIWVGEGFVEGSYYQWNKVSYTESELNGGNYMDQCYSMPLFCHSGIHSIVPVKYFPEGSILFLVTTDGGIYETSDFTFYTSMNKGFNTTQFNEFAVSPDGSIIGGAMDNSCPFVQSRNAHYGGEPDSTWYSNENDLEGNRNTIANVLWFGNGGQTAASMFQRLLPNVRRGIFTSSEGGSFYFSDAQGTHQAANFGRGCNDYADYTNTQTWTIGEAFVEDALAEAHAVPHMVLWETSNNTFTNDQVTFTLDTLGCVFRGDTAFYFSSKYHFKSDTVGYYYLPNDSIAYVVRPSDYTSAVNFQIKAGDRYIANSRQHFNYPFDYFFANDRTIFDTSYRTHTSAGQQITDTNYSILSITTHNPIANRLFVNGKNGKGLGVINMTMTPTDYSKVWTVSDAGNFNRTMHWFNLYRCPNGYQPSVMAVSQDGDALFSAIVNDSLGFSYVLRISNISAADATNMDAANGQLTYQPDYEGMVRITRFDTIKLADGTFAFTRPITSISVDPRQGKDAIVITFGGEGEGDNVLYVNNANNINTRTVTPKNIQGGNIPVYSSLILTVDPADQANAAKSGSILVGTENGVFEQAANGTSWSEIGAFDGVPVTAIHQQVNTLQEQKYIGHTGINAEQYLFGRTKFPYAVYFGTYGRGIFMDRTYVTNTVNDIIDENDYPLLDIPQVESNGENSVAVYPNPVSDYANINLNVCSEGHALVQVYDLMGKLVLTQDLGNVQAGNHNYSLNCSDLRHGMYLINVHFGNGTASAKLIVR